MAQKRKARSPKKAKKGGASSKRAPVAASDDSKRDEDAAAEAPPAPKKKRRVVASGESSAKASASERDEPEKRAERPPRGEASEGAGSLVRSWWIVVVLGVVLAYVVYTHLRNREEEVDESLTPVEVPDDGPRAERLRVEVINRFHHETDAFTQGLLWHEGFLYESTGQRRRSSIRKVDLETGEVVLRRANEDRIFAEGLARVGEELYQLSWTAHEARVYRLSDFEPVRTYEYQGQGWGLCFDGTHLVMSNGSDRLVFRDPETFDEVRSVRVVLDGRPRDQLNELECVDGVVWANVWQSDDIVRIDPSTGLVSAVVDASGLLSPNEAWVADVLNGIAWVPERGHFVITGKYWPYLFEVDFVPDDGDHAEEDEEDDDD